MNIPSKSKNDMAQKTGSGAGRPVAWMEVVRKDGERLNSFFSDLFGWETAEMAPGSHYGVMEARPHGIGGGIGPSRRGRGTLRSSSKSRISKPRSATSSAWEGRGSPDRSIFPTSGPRQAGAGP